MPLTFSVTLHEGGFPELGAYRGDRCATCDLLRGDACWQFDTNVLLDGVSAVLHVRNPRMEMDGDETGTWHVPEWDALILRTPTIEFKIDEWEEGDPEDLHADAWVDAVSREVRAYT